MTILTYPLISQVYRNGIHQLNPEPVSILAPSQLINSKTTSPRLTHHGVQYTYLQERVKTSTNVTIAQKLFYIT